MPRTITENQLKTLREAYESTLGTADYTKYLMCTEYKRKENNKWTRWYFLGWYIPTTGAAEDFYVKPVGNKLYLMRECCLIGDDTGVERYEITPAVKDLLGI